MPEISDLGRSTQIGNWSREVWGPALKGPNGIRGKAPENIWLFDTYKALEPI